MKNDPSKQYERPVKEFSEDVVEINRISKKTKGGNQMRFSALVVVGDGKGRVGAGMSKAKDVRSAIQKAVKAAQKKLINVTFKGTTVPFEITEKLGAARVMLKPAPKGSGIIAGGPMRVVLEAAGYSDAVGKIFGTNNKVANVHATIAALKKINKLAVRKESVK